MAIVTGKYIDSSGAALPAGTVREVSATPSRPFTTLDGKNVSGRPQTVTPNAATGAYTFNLEPTPAGVSYLIKGAYLVPGSHKHRDHFEERIPVPPGGGSVGELAGKLVGRDDVYVAPDAVEPTQHTGFQFNTVTGDLYQWQE